jgi:glycosyltransferase involved in cell wall biosynthesis
MPQAMPKIMAAIHSLDASGGGSQRTASALYDSLGSLGVSVDLFAMTFNASEPKLVPRSPQVRTHLVKGFHNERLRVSWSPRFRVELQKQVKGARPNVVHAHGIWNQSAHSAAAVARANGVPLVISAHGMLTLWSMQHKAAKKKLAWWLYQKKDLATAAAVHVASQLEADELRQLGFRGPIALVPNGVDLPEWVPPTNGKPPFTALFLSRIHPKKGLVDLIKAWAALRPADWRCVIAGPSEGGHREELERLVRAEKLEGAFSFPGEVVGQAKWQLYRSADLFVLPTYSENFGLVVPESLACGVPVLTTKGTPWSDLVTEKAGYWIEVGQSPLEAALKEAFALSVEERRTMGRHGRAMVVGKYSWEKMGATMLQVYQWILGGQRPAAILL